MFNATYCREAAEHSDTKWILGPDPISALQRCDPEQVPPLSSWTSGDNSKNVPVMGLR